MSAESTAYHHKSAHVLIATGLVTFAALAAGLAYAPLTEYHKLLIRSLEAQTCNASPTRGQRMIFLLPF